MKIYLKSKKYLLPILFPCFSLLIHCFGTTPTPTPNPPPTLYVPPGQQSGVEPPPEGYQADTGQTAEKSVPIYYQGMDAIREIHDSLKKQGLETCFKYFKPRCAHFINKPNDQKGSSCKDVPIDWEKSYFWQGTGDCLKLTSSQKDNDEQRSKENEQIIACTSLFETMKDFYDHADERLKDVNSAGTIEKFKKDEYCFHPWK